jgi:hypothetical protein
MSHGGEWDRVPPQPPRQDGTAQDTDRFDVDHELPGSGWRIALLWGAIALVFVAMLWLVLNGGGR